MSGYQQKRAQSIQGPSTDSVDPCQYSVQSGDSLSAIAEKFRGGIANWPGVYGQNNHIVGDDPNHIEPGQELNVCAPTATPGVLGPQPLADDDYEGQMDRVKAEMELADKFEIVDDDFMGPKKPNQLSQEEFERVAGTYSDIQKGNTNLQFDTTNMDDKKSADFKSKVMGDMSNILTTSSGRDLLTQLAYGTNPNNGNAYTTTLIDSANPGAAGSSRSAGTKFEDMGNGVGVNNVLKYAPGVDTDMAKTMSPNYESADFRHITSDTILFHELTHALHKRDGSRPETLVGAEQSTISADDKVKQEEYNTIGLGAAANNPITENAYRAERELVTGQDIPQRGSYLGPGRLLNPATPKTSRPTP